MCCTLGSNPDDFVKVYNGKVKRVSYNYQKDEFRRISAEIFFERGSVFIETEKALNIAKNDRIFFTAEMYDGMADNGDYIQEWWVIDLLKVERPQTKKLSPKQKQIQRLTEAIG